MPDHGHTVSRTHLDTVLLKHAESAGAEVRQSAEVTGPELDANGRVIGVTLKGGEKVYGDAVIAADGAYSPIKRALKIDSEYNGYSAIAIRSEMHANRPDSDSSRHLSEAGVPGRPAARLRLGVPDGQRRVQHRARLRQQLQELAVDQRDPVPRRVPADAAAATGSCRRSRS